MNKLIIKEKKGILFSATLKIIISVLCIILLIYLTVKVFGLFQKQEEIEKANIALASIVEKVNIVNNGESEYQRVIIFPPNEWFLKSYGNYAAPENFCKFDKNCLCICEEYDCSGTNLVCQDFNEFDVEVVGLYQQIKSGSSGTGGRGFTSIEVSENKLLQFTSSSIELEILKEDEIIKIRERIVEEQNA